jgi:hypothetical protein
MSDNLIYYSTNTYLAYYLSQNFYNSEHFVWCSPVFDPTTLDAYHKFRKIPPSSSPCNIYHNLYAEVKQNDLHSLLIQRNQNGLRKGATLHLSEGKISELEYARILKIIDLSNINDFRPLIYVIPVYMVKNKVKIVEVDVSANPLSVEYQIFNLTRHEFDIIELRNGLYV